MRACARRRASNAGLSPTKTMRAVVALIALLALGVACLAGEIRIGATMQVKANSIWFQDAGKFARWQALKQSGDAKALAAYQEDVLHQRDAWQFIYPLSVTILGYEPEENRVDVEMKTEGRLQGSQWLLDAGALETAVQ
jgi:hypothetical protein